MYPTVVIFTAKRTSYMSSNVSQNYPYSSESDEERASAVAEAFEANEGLQERVAEESKPLGEIAAFL